MRNRLTLVSIGRVDDQTIAIHKRWAKALDGIEGYSHLIVLYWLNEARKPELKLHPKGIKAIPKMGVLATRAPHRFNPIGVTVVRLIKRQGSKLKVKGLDAWDGTPVLDIKPYTPKDSILKVRIRAWAKRLDRLKKNAS